VNWMFDALDGAADGAFVIDSKLRIIFWNKAAERILGFTEEEVTGRFCHQLLQGRDEGQNLICNAQCRVAKLALHSKPVPNYDIRTGTKNGESRWLNMSVFAYRINDDEGKKAVVHLFHDTDPEAFDQKYLTRVIEAIRSYQENPTGANTEMKANTERLTSREIEVLTLLAKGHGTREIAENFSISPNTVRNHIQNILQKLQVHTRLDAVTHAIKNGLIRY